MGRPSLDPVVFFQCMLIGFFENILSDTEWEYRIADSLTLRRFLGYSLAERTPDESTLRKTRQRMPEEAFRAVFARVLDQCQAAGLLQGRAIGTDSTLVDANASMDSLRHKTLGCTYEEYIVALRRQDQPTATREEAAAADRKRGSGKASNQDWASPTDPDAGLANVSDPADFLFRVDEAVETLAERGLTVAAVVADKGHHRGENLAGLEERGRVGLVASPNTARGQPGFRREDFRYEAEQDELVCPAGAVLRRRPAPVGSAAQYQARGRECRACPHFGVCTKSQSGRHLSVPVDELLITANRERVHAPEVRPLLQIRRQRGEAPFGYFKQFGGLRRLAGRGLAYATKKTLIGAVGWNLLRLLSPRAAAPEAAPSARRLPGWMAAM